QIAREEKEAELATQRPASSPSESLCTDQERSGLQKCHYPAADDGVELTQGSGLGKPLLTTRLILIQRYKTDEYSTRNAGREAG
ncbi:host-nuclease inhibitor protein Gam, partial [Escherichia coli]|uniref:host-nuclease inhibitor protein Gam n=1 Tax=Escherichia coli TaxID=562 RepID=UPI00201AB64A